MAEKDTEKKGNTAKKRMPDADAAGPAGTYAADTPQEQERYWLSESQRADLGAVLTSPFGGEMIRPFARTIFLRHMPVAGIYHVRNYKSLLKKIREDDRLLLIREPQNAYDEWAILVMTQEREKLGYIPRRENRILARLMDAGKSIFAEVSEIDPDPDRWDPLWIAIYMDD